MVGLREHVRHRAAPRGISVQGAVQLIGRQVVGQFLGARPIVDPHEGIIGHGVADAIRSQFARQPAMAVAIELQAERRPGGNAQVDQPELGVLEVEIVVQTLAAVRPDESLVCLLVVPGLVSIAGLHGGDDVHQARMIATPLEDPRHNLLLANVAFCYVLDCHSGLGGQRCRAVAHTITQLHRELRVVENTDTLAIQIPGHPTRITDAGQCPGDYHAVVARQRSGDPIVITVRQRLAHPAPRQMTLLAREPTPNLLVPAPPA